MTDRRFAILEMTLLSFGMTFAAQAIAQDKFPSRPVTVVVPQAAGGANDAIARVIAQKLSEQWGLTVLVENRPGAGGNVATTFCGQSQK